MSEKVAEILQILNDFFVGKGDCIWVQTIFVSYGKNNGLFSVTKWHPEQRDLHRISAAFTFKFLLKPLIYDRITVAQLLFHWFLASAPETSCICLVWPLFLTFQTLWNGESPAMRRDFVICNTTGFNSSLRTKKLYGLSKLQDLGVLPGAPGTGWIFWCIQARSFANVWGMQCPYGREKQLVCNGILWSRWSKNWHTEYVGGCI